MRRVEEGFGESIPAAVKRVYRAPLTIPGDATSGSATHLEALPKTLTAPVLHQVLAIVVRRGIQKNDLVNTLGRRGGFRSRIGSPIKSRNFATTDTMPKACVDPRPVTGNIENIATLKLTVSRQGNSA
jgi:hypothetical protein